MGDEEDEKRHCAASASALWDRAFDGEQIGVSEDMFADLLIRERALAREQSAAHIADLQIAYDMVAAKLAAIERLCGQPNGSITYGPPSCRVKSEYVHISRVREILRGEL